MKKQANQWVGWLWGRGCGFGVPQGGGDVAEKPDVSVSGVWIFGYTPSQAFETFGSPQQERCSRLSFPEDIVGVALEVKAS